MTPAASPARETAGRSPKVSAATQAANRFVAAHLPEASALGVSLADLVYDPDAFAQAIAAGFQSMADPVYAAAQPTVAPGIGPVLGVRLPLMDAAHRSFKRETKRMSSGPLLDVMDRLLRQQWRELRWFAIWNLSRLVATDPERAWQLLRRAAREADEWITVDTLAHPYGEGILREPRRWAEIEQLVYSPSRWERRLVGSTLATMPFTRLPGSRDPEVGARGIDLIAQLIGDREPDVQKALSWALRNFAAIDLPAVRGFLEAEAANASQTNDGHRAWVIRDTLPKLPADADRIKRQLEGIRRQPGAPSTSTASATAAAFMSGFAPTPED